MPVYFTKGTDTGLDAASSITPVSNGEPLNQTTLNRPTELLRVRTEELKRVSRELENISALMRSASVSLIRTDQLGTNSYNTAKKVLPGTASITKSTAAKLIATPGYEAYKFCPDVGSALLVSCPGFFSGKAILTRAAFDNYYANSTSPEDLYLRSAGDMLALVVDRSPTNPTNSGLGNGIALQELDYGDERTLPGVAAAPLSQAATTYLKKFPQRTFLVLKRATSAVPANQSLLDVLASQQDSAGNDLLTVEEAGMTSTVASGTIRIRITEAPADWVERGGRAGKHVAVDGTVTFDNVDVIRVHSAASVEKHTGIPASEVAGGVEVSHTNDFRLLVPYIDSTTEGLNWQLFGPTKTAGTEVIASEANTAHIVPSLQAPGHLVIPLVTFTGESFEFLGGSSAPLQDSGEVGSLTSFELPYSRDSKGLVIQTVTVDHVGESGTFSVDGTQLRGSPLLTKVVIDIEEAFSVQGDASAHPRLSVGTTTTANAFTERVSLLGLGRYEVDLTEAHLLTPAGFTPSTSVTYGGNLAYDAGMAVVSFYFYYP